MYCQAVWHVRTFNIVWYQIVSACSLRRMRYKSRSEGSEDCVFDRLANKVRCWLNCSLQVQSVSLGVELALWAIVINFDADKNVWKWLSGMLNLLIIETVYPKKIFFSIFS